MTSKTIYITDNDMRRLRELIMVARQFKKEEEKFPFYKESIDYLKKVSGRERKFLF